MASALWRGNWISRTRIATGLVLFTYAFFHFINLGLGLFTPGAMEEMQDARHLITRNAVGGVILISSLLLHAGLALWNLAQRRSWRMPMSEAVQTILGLLIPFQLLRHITHTSIAHQGFGVNDEYPYIIVLMWNGPPVWWQTLLLLVVWVHGCMGLHFWLRLTTWWQKALPYLIGLAVFIPSFALAGLLTEGRRIYDIFVEGSQRAALMADFNWPSAEDFAELRSIETQLVSIFLGLLILTGLAFGLRKIMRRRRSVQIRYAHGPSITVEKGMTLLEMSQAKGIPHAALCGGKGRCTTCRVIIEEGLEQLHPPTPAEARSLAAVRADGKSRLACQIRPETDMTVCRLFRPDGSKGRAHASQGEERELAILFLDMRGFTARTTGQLPYDVVFLLNRFFDAIVPSIVGAGGHVDKYLGDGLLAVFDLNTPEKSAQAALTSTIGISAALKTFNKMLVSEGADPVKIGIGLHLGELVLGEIGTTGNAPRTIIGDAVNTASRLEGRTKEFGAEVIISEPLLSAAGCNIVKEEMVSLDLRGVAHPVLALVVSHGAAIREFFSAGPQGHSNSGQRE